MFATTCFAALHGLPTRPRFRRSQLTTPIARTDLLLLTSERTYLALIPSPTTVTFFRGRVGAARPELARRIAAVLRINPWLSAKVEPGKQGSLAATYDPDPLVDPHYAVRYDLTVPRDARYAELVRVLEQARVSPAVVSGFPLWRCTVVPLGASMFAVVISGAHAFVDAHTHYAVQRMVLGGAPVQTLPAVRKHQALTGLRDQEWDPPIPVLRMVSLVLSMAWGDGSAGPMRAYEIDSSWLRTRRAEMRAQGVVVSSNDILLFELARCDGGIPYSTMVLPVDLRLGRRVDCLEPNDVGNYLDTLVLQKQNLASPLAVRQCVSAWQLGESTRVASQQQLRNNAPTRSVVVSNWTLFASSTSLPGAEAILHLPAVLNPAWPDVVLVIVFRPEPGKLGIAVHGPQQVLASIRASKMVAHELNVPA